MGKRILIVSMLVLVMLLLMPSIPAIQQNSIKEGIKQDLQEKLESITLDDLKEIVDSPFIKLPMLYGIVMFIGLFRAGRGVILIELSGHWEMPGWRLQWVVDYPRLDEWGWWLYDTGLDWLEYWYWVSYENGWGWFQWLED